MQMDFCNSIGRKADFISCPSESNVAPKAETILLAQFGHQGPADRHAAKSSPSIADAPRFM